ncbi:MAG: ComF family protein [Oscillospiraceae bacterium]
MSGFDMVKTDRKEMLIDLIFPNRCPFCGKVIHWSRYCCEDCYKKAEWINFDNVRICRRCGHYVCECDKEKIYCDRCFFAASYSDENVKNAVLALKYKQSKNAAVIFSQRLYELLKSESCTDIDCIVPVPMNRKKQRRRGYNQSEILAEHLSELLDSPVRTDLIGKRYSSETQHSRTAEERKAAAETEYFSLDKRLNGEKILLCDDIFTTGSTVSRCAELLKNIGASSVTAAVCAAVL